MRGDVAGCCGTLVPKAESGCLQSPPCLFCLHLSLGQMPPKSQFKCCLSQGAVLYSLPGHPELFLSYVKPCVCVSGLVVTSLDSLPTAYSCQPTGYYLPLLSQILKAKLKPAGWP